MFHVCRASCTDWLSPIQLNLIVHSCVLLLHYYPGKGNELALGNMLSSVGFVMCITQVWIMQFSVCLGLLLDIFCFRLLFGIKPGCYFVYWFKQRHGYFMAEQTV